MNRRGASIWYTGNLKGIRHLTEFRNFSFNFFFLDKVRKKENKWKLPVADLGDTGTRAPSWHNFLYFHAVAVPLWEILDPPLAITLKVIFVVRIFSYINFKRFIFQVYMLMFFFILFNPIFASLLNKEDKQISLQKTYGNSQHNVSVS